MRVELCLGTAMSRGGSFVALVTGVVTRVQDGRVWFRDPAVTSPLAPVYVSKADDGIPVGEVVWMRTEQGDEYRW
jgi:hypothetical protein